MTPKSTMSVDVDCPYCDVRLSVPIRIIKSLSPLTFEPDYTEAQRHVLAHEHMSLRDHHKEATP